MVARLVEQRGTAMRITGTAGNDNLVGTADYDIISAGAGDATIDGGAGPDKMAGQDGNDTFLGGAGVDYMDGGAGVDSVNYERSNGAVTVDLRSGRGFGADAEGDTLVGIENLVGSQYNDTLTGNAGDNTLKGGFGNDRLSGNEGSDVLIGGLGNDQLTGGSEADTFVFMPRYYGQQGDADVITDFQVGTDVLQFHNAYWGNGVQSVDDLMFSQAGSDTVISYGYAGDSITLRNVDLEQLMSHAASDFLFT
jgi:Ca2+-binding RTX toxin-like protein